MEVSDKKPGHHLVSGFRAAESGKGIFYGPTGLKRIIELVVSAKQANPNRLPKPSLKR